MNATACEDVMIFERRIPYNKNKFVEEYCDKLKEWVSSKNSERIKNLNKCNNAETI